MKTKVGLWIDHQRAVIAAVTPGGEKMLHIESKVETQPGRIAGKRSTAPFDAYQEPADDRLQRWLTVHLNDYYDVVIAAVRRADEILIFGPSEAKLELKKRLEKDGLGERIVGVETMDRISDHQIAAKVRNHFRSKMPGAYAYRNSNPRVSFPGSRHF